MDQTGKNGDRAVEKTGGNRDALIEGNIVADERQLDPDAAVSPDETGSDRVMSTGENDGIRDPSGAYGGREQGAEDTLKDGSIPADADLDMPSDAMNDPEQLEDDSRS